VKFFKKNILILSIILIFFSLCHGQNEKSAIPTIQTGKKLFYFSTADSTKVGVKDEDGKIIIPAKFHNYHFYNFQEAITDPTIELWHSAELKNVDPLSPAMPVSEVFDRNGNFLYYAQFYDNGPDYYEEGVRRFVENGKIGFVNKSGEKVLPAIWEFASSFSYGYATAYTGHWKKKYEKGGERWSIVPASETSENFIINKKGERVYPYPQPKDPKDFKKAENEYYPYPFKYNNFEKKLIESLEKLDVLNDLSLRNLGTTNQKREELLLQFEIIEYPFENYPYYILQGYRQQYKEDDMIFAISEDGKHYYHADFYIQKLIPIKDWIIEELIYSEEYFRLKQNRAFPFDVKKHLDIWNKK